MKRGRASRGWLVGLLVLVVSGCGFLEPPPQLSLTASPQSGKAPLAVTFNLGISGTYEPFWSCKLDFGDGSNPVPVSGCAGSVTHTYQRAGTYAATFTVYDDHAYERATKKVTITVQ